MTKSVTNSFASLGYRPETRSFRAEWEVALASASAVVVDALAEVMAVDPLDLSPLYNSIDTDNLDAMVHPNGALRSPVTISFSHEGHTITVSSEGTVDIFPVDHDAELND